MCQSFDWDGECSSKSKVANLDVSLVRDQQILRLQISVNNPLGVAVVNTSEQLVNHLLNHSLIHVSLVFSHVFLKIILDKFKNQVEFLLVWLKDDLFKTKRF